MDRLVPGEIHRPELLSVVPGGKAINVARAAAGLGLPVTVVPVIAGHAGAWMEEALGAGGLAARPVRSRGRRGPACPCWTARPGRLTEFYEAGPAARRDGLGGRRGRRDGRAGGRPAGTVVVVSGSHPVGAPGGCLARLVRLAGAAGGRCAVDTAGRALSLAVQPGPWLAKVNAAEAGDATGLATDTEAGTLAAARALRAAGGRDRLRVPRHGGAVLVDETGAAWRVGPPPERGPYSVGSGDSLLAGFLAALAAGATTAEAARQGSAAAAANALRPGQGVLDPDDVARLLPADHPGPHR